MKCRAQLLTQFAVQFVIRRFYKIFAAIPDLLAITPAEKNINKSNQVLKPLEVFVNEAVPLVLLVSLYRKYVISC